MVFSRVVCFFVFVFVCVCVCVCVNINICRNLHIRLGVLMAVAFTGILRCVAW
jgi:hypothetical protein